MASAHAPTIVCPFCAAPSTMTPAVSMMDEHRQAREATGGERIPLRHKSTFTVVQEGPGGEMPPCTYRRLQCERCGYGEAFSIPGNGGGR